MPKAYGGSSKMEKQKKGQARMAKRDLKVGE